MGDSNGPPPLTSVFQTKGNEKRVNLRDGRREGEKLTY